MKRFAFVIALLVALVPAALWAQQTGAVSGTVIDTDGGPVSGAAVQVAGTDIGILANDEGQFRLTGVPVGTVTLRASRLGYGTAEQTVEVRAGETTGDVRIELSVSAVRLDELVVTGTAGEQIRRAQPAQIASIDAAQIVQNAPTPNISDVLAAREPGVSVQLTSGQSGTGQRIRVRGNASIALSNEPLVYVDGIRADSRNELARPDNPGRFDAIGGGAITRLNDLNPNDIQRIEIVKGPAAATLYGADASAGVIQIITKKGAENSDFSHRFAAEYHSLDVNFDPPANFATCTQAAIDAGATLCQGQPVGALVSDNPLEREDVFRRGEQRSLAWNGSGGGENYSFFLSGRWADEDGTVSNNTYDQRQGRVNVAWDPEEKVSLDLSYGFSNVITTLPMGNHSTLGIPTIALLGAPLTVGLPNNGWIFTGGGSEALLAVENEIRAVRHTVSVSTHYRPVDFFSTRLIVGGDYTNTERMQFFPKNEGNWYGGETDRGSINENRKNFHLITLDWLGTFQRAFGADDQISAELSTGIQWIQERQDLAVAAGVGLANNDARAVSAAAERTGSQWFQDLRSLGYLLQGQVGYKDRLYLQVGARWDENSAFGEEAGLFFLPKAGISYVISDEAFWPETFPFISTMRLRGAYGSTGRAPRAAQSLRTYAAAPFITPAGGLGSGLTLLNPGNTDLRAEKGRELELGVDMGLFDERVALEVTYFSKNTEDLILARPIPPSLGFSESPFDNVGEVVNRGVEIGAFGRVLEIGEFAWDADVAMNTLHNELVDLGDLTPFGDLDKRFIEGYPLGSIFQQKILSVDTGRGVGIVSDTLVFLGSTFPTWEGHVGSTLTLFGDLVTIRGQADWRTGHLIRNGTRNFRCKGIVVCQQALDPDFLSEEERIRMFGPFETADGEPVSSILVEEAYYEDADFLRLREVSVGFRIPERFVSFMSAESARLTFGARNLHVWTGYSGVDPEVGSNLATEFGEITEGEFFAMPPVKRYTARFDITF